MKNLNIKAKIFIVISILIVLITIGIYVFKQMKEEEYNDYEKLEINNNNTDEETYNIEDNNEDITVHITGEVNYPRSSYSKRRKQSCRCNRSSRRRNRKCRCK